MNDKELYERLKVIASNINNNSPLLLLCDASKIFKSKYTETIINCNDDLNKVKNVLIINLSSFKDLSILKYYNLPVVFLSDDDNLSLDFMSSMKTVIKYTRKSKSNFVNSKDALQILKEGDNNISKNTFYATESPELYYYKNKFSMNKYINLFSSE